VTQTVISQDGKDLTCVWRITVSIQKHRFANASLHSWEPIAMIVAGHVAGITKHELTQGYMRCAAGLPS
jgi:hypothetical protein